MLAKVFKAYDVRATYPKPLDEKLAWQIGYGAAQYLLSQAAAEGERRLVLGEMAELGEQSVTSHVEVGRAARARGVTRLFATGPTALHAVEAFGAGGRWFPDLDALAAEVDAALHPGVTLLIKGSRVNRLERLVEALCQPALRVGNGTGG